MTALARLAGLLDAERPDHAESVIARVAPQAPVRRLGPLAISAQTPPARVGPVSACLIGSLHNRGALAARLALAPDAPAAAVLAQLYQREGRDGLSALRGEYQLALWDAERGLALLAPDHLGGRALFFGQFGRQVAVGGEILDVAAAAPRALAPNLDVVPIWIANRVLPVGETLYEGVHRVRTGHVLEIASGRVRTVAIWRPRYAPPPARSPEEAADVLREAVRESIGRRLTADGPTGVLLSGGFDSATVAGLGVAMVEDPSKLRAYSSVFPGEPFDESPMVDELLDRYGLDGTQLRPGGGALSTALAFQARWGLPSIAPGAILNLPLLERARADGVGVMLDGQGGDELFSASNQLLTDLLLGLRLGQARRLAHRFPGVGARIQAWQARAMLKQVVLAGAQPARWQRPDPGQVPAWLSADGQSRVNESDTAWGWKRLREPGPRWWSWLSHTLVEAREELGMQDFMRQIAGVAGVRASHPLLTDVDLVECVLSLPPHLAFAPEHDRALARQAMAGIVPDSIRLPRRKSRYGAFMLDVLNRVDRPAMTAILGRRDAEIGAFVDLAAVRAMVGSTPDEARLDERVDGWEHHSWALVTMELWLRSLALGDAFPAWMAQIDVAPSQVEAAGRSR